MPKRALSPPRQADLFGAESVAPAPRPPGLRYQPDVLTEAEEAEIARQLAALQFEPFNFHGYLGNRRVVSFGLTYDYARRAVESAPPLPDFLRSLRDRAAALAGRPAEDFTQALANEYAPGAGIGWHRDKPHFGEVVGISLLAPCVMRFRRRTPEGFERIGAPLAPRAAYLLTGPARWEWEHSITPMDAPRYSITFRTRVDP